MSATNEEHRIYRKDFKPSPYYVEEVHLTFNLDYDVTEVYNEMVIKQRSPDAGDLVLNGNFIELKSLHIEGREISSNQYKFGTRFEETALVIPKSLLNESGSTKVRVHNVTFPRKNLQLMGLYVSNKLLATQCEPEGFRRITYYIDQPSNMSKYTVKLVGSKKDFPTLLSNGDEVSREDLGEKHAATFVDPFPKPGHLFAICAGELTYEKAEFTTMGGRKVDIYVMAEPQYKGQLSWALKMAVAAFKWDEKVFGREYDLNTFRAIGISDFNMGAMENKSLNLFNISAIVAKEDRTRDWFYKRVAHVVAHEYFHNWSGNRVSVQDWFQVQLKEGFTAFRETRFIEDTFGKGVTRISQVMDLRGRQFPEDAGPTSHSIRPESYVTIDNFYTATIYGKGKEVIRLYYTLLGAEGFRKGCDLYFSKYDGQAVSCDHFRGAMAEANNRDLTQFELWYTQRRTPRLTVLSRSWNADAKQYIIKIRQSLPDDANYGNPVQPLHIPIICGFVGKTSKTDVRPQLVLELTQWEQEFTLDGVTEDCVPSILRDFSAPVILESFLSNEELAFLMAYDSDSFNMWESGQILYGDLIISRTQEAMAGKLDLKSPPALPAYIEQAVELLLGGRVSDKGVTALCLSLPCSALTSRVVGLDPYVLWQAHESVVKQIAQKYESQFKKLMSDLAQPKGKVEHDAESIGARSLRNTCIGYLAHLGDTREDIQQLVVNEFTEATCFNNKVVVAGSLVNVARPEVEGLMRDFYTECKGLSEVVADDWFRAIGGCSREGAFDLIRKVASEHPDFVGTKNPNRMRSLVGPVMGNAAIFHHPSGEGYRWVADILKEWDTFNSPVASVMAKTLVGYSQFDAATQARMKEACRSILESGHCSKQMKEIVGPACN